MLYFFDLLGVAVFAVSGALVAADKRMDLFGGMVLAIVTGIGGGTLRDLLLGAPVFWIGDPSYILVAAGTALVTEMIGFRTGGLPKPLAIADAFGLGLFMAMGTAKALDMGAPATTAVVMGVMTGVAGGAIRDVLAREIPMVLRGELYATACVAGSVVMLVAYQMTDALRFAAWIGLITTLVVRLAAIRWHLHLPQFLGGKATGTAPATAGLEVGDSGSLGE